MRTLIFMLLGGKLKDELSLPINSKIKISLCPFYITIAYPSLMFLFNNLKPYRFSCLLFRDISHFSRLL